MIEPALKDMPIFGPERKSSQELEQVAYNTAVDAAIKASEKILPYWPNPLNPYFNEKLVLEVIKKEGIGNYATLADIQSEKVIIQTIQAQPLFKNHSIVAEESGEIKADSNWRWIIDPIDGTPNFRNGNPDFGIAIALFNGQKPILGLIAMPGLKQMVVAKSGDEAKLLTFDGKQLANLKDLASKYNDSLEKALVGYDLGYEEREKQVTDVLAKVIPRVGYASCLASFSTGHFRLVQGMMGVYFGASPTIMDIAPAATLIPAIGGVVTGFDGKLIDWTAQKRTYVSAINPQIHQEFLELLKK